MPAIHRTAIVPYSAERMYDLVNDVESYPAYLPWCREAEVLEREPERLSARLQVAKGPVHHDFTTANTMQPGRRIEIALVEGPFKSLSGTWRFEPLGESGCSIQFDLSFQTKGGGLVGLALGKVFNEIANSLVDAFCRRARSLYGPG